MLVLTINERLFVLNPPKLKPKSRERFSTTRVRSAFTFSVFMQSWACLLLTPFAFCLHGGVSRDWKGRGLALDASTVHTAQGGNEDEPNHHETEWKIRIKYS